MLVGFSSLTVTTLSMALMAFSLTYVLCKYNSLVNPNSVYVCACVCGLSHKIILFFVCNVWYSHPNCFYDSSGFYDQTKKKKIIIKKVEKEKKKITTLFFFIFCIIWSLLPLMRAVGGLISFCCYWEHVLSLVLFAGKHLGYHYANFSSLFVGACLLQSWRHHSVLTGPVW